MHSSEVLQVQLLTGFSLLSWMPRRTPKQEDGQQQYSQLEGFIKTTQINLAPNNLHLIDTCVKASRWININKLPFFFGLAGATISMNNWAMWKKKTMKNLILLCVGALLKYLLEIPRWLSPRGHFTVACCHEVQICA